MRSYKIICETKPNVCVEFDGTIKIAGETVEQCEKYVISVLGIKDYTITFVQVI